MPGGNKSAAADPCSSVEHGCSVSLAAEVAGVTLTTAVTGARVFPAARVFPGAAVSRAMVFAGVGVLRALVVARQGRAAIRSGTVDGGGTWQRGTMRLVRQGVNRGHELRVRELCQAG
jgi:hypothetical protein